MLITDDSEWIVLDLDPPPNINNNNVNVVITTSSSSSISSTSTLIHHNPAATGVHIKDQTATNTEIHTTTRYWQHIIRWLYVSYPKLCDVFFYFILIDMLFLLPFLSFLHRHHCISFEGSVGNALMINMDVWAVFYMLLISCLIIEHAIFTVRSWWCTSVYVIPIPNTHIIPYNCTTFALLISLISITLYSLSSISPFYSHYKHSINYTLLICIFGYPVWCGWYDVRAKMETLHIYYTGMGDIARLQIRHMEKQQQQQQQNTHSQLHANQEHQQTSLGELCPASSSSSSSSSSWSPSSSSVTDSYPNPIPTTTCAAFALFLSQLDPSFSSFSSSSGSSPPTRTPSPPSSSHVTLCRMHLITCLECVMIAAFSIVIGALI